MQSTRARAKGPLFWASLLALLIGCVALAWALVETVLAGRTGFEDKTLWDWLKLLVVPVVLAGAAAVFSLFQQRTELEIARER